MKISGTDYGRPRRALQIAEPRYSSEFFTEITPLSSYPRVPSPFRLLHTNYLDSGCLRDHNKYKSAKV